MTGHHSAAFLGSIQFELYGKVRLQRNNNDDEGQLTSERSSSCAGLKELAALEDATVGAMTMPNTDGAKVKPMPGADAPGSSFRQNMYAGETSRHQERKWVTKREANVT